MHFVYHMNLRIELHSEEHMHKHNLCRLVLYMYLRVSYTKRKSLVQKCRAIKTTRKLEGEEKYVTAS